MVMLMLFGVLPKNSTKMHKGEQMQMIKRLKKALLKSIINDLLKDLPEVKIKILELLKAKEEFVIAKTKEGIKAKLIEIANLL